ncbi:hypothetical protein MM440_15810 [Arsenicicoccus piscis]|uniref:hypothetical protein n=1 Tax=Arsenicicoccus piscis TaxID=673954 RepID=UPI001F4CF208|nr:hypothetical protein [Arsenicicoccus piscis]MCH8628736.1 hypothetical protein [Arsenicicoccus piscis]MCH8629199.1 hypothetical protein [Arsenicicoccus piscis]
MAASSPCPWVSSRGGLIASAVDPHRLMVVSGVVYLIVALGTLTIRSVRTLPDQA